MLKSALLSALLFIASLAGHAQASYAQEYDEIIRLKGRVKQVTERSYNSESNTDSLPHRKHKPFGTEIYWLDTSGRLTKRTSDGGRYGTDICHYRYRGDTIIRTYYNNKVFQRRLITVQNRDSQGRIGQVRYFVEDYRGALPLTSFTNRYDSQGHLTGQVYYSESGQQYPETRYENDDHGNHLRVVPAESGISGEEYTYDDHDNPVTEHRSAPEGAMSFPDIRYRYLYDGQGNWVQKTAAYEGGEVKDVTIRTILYWP